MTAISRHQNRLGKLILRRLLQLDEVVPERSEAELIAEAEENYRWNFTANLLDGVWFWFGINFISASTILPLFVSKITQNPLLIGLIAVIAQGGWYLPQLLTAGPTEQVARKKSIVVNLGLFTERFPMWFLPAAALIVPYSPTLALFVFFLGLTWHHLGAGIVAPSWQDLIARCFPAERRGGFMGLTTFIGTGAGALGAFLSAWILGKYSFPLNFIYIFAIGAGAITMSWAFLALTREPVQAVSPESRIKISLQERVGKVLRDDPNFRRFLMARFVTGLGLMAVGFVTVAAIRRWDIPDSTVGIYTALQLVGQTGGSLLSGWLADRFGHKLSLEVGALAAAAAFFLAWIAPAAWWYYLVFLIMGIALGIKIVSGILIALEFPEPQKRPTYVGMANTVLGVASVLAPLIGGWIATFSYPWLFALSVVIGLLGFGLLHWTVQEPRWARQAQQVG